jgi:small-conductance mechanosensitive channel
MTVVEHSFKNLMMEIHPYRVRDWALNGLFEGTPVFLAGLGFLAAGFLVAWIIYKLVLYCGLPKNALRHFRMAHSKDGRSKVETFDGNGRVHWKDVSAGDIEAQNFQKTTKQSRRHAPIFYSARSSVIHFVALLLKYSIIVFSFYLAFGIAGVSIFSLAFSLGIIGLIGTYAFSDLLYNTAGAFVISGTGKWVEHMVVAIAGRKGIIIEQGTLFTTLRCKDEKTGKYYLSDIPNRYFNQSIIDRFIEEEEGLENFSVDHIEHKMTTNPQKQHTIIKMV